MPRAAQIGIDRNAFVWESPDGSSVRAEYLVDAESFTKVDGLPIFTRDVMEQVRERVR